MDKTGKLVGIAKLSVLAEEIGEDGILAMVATRVAEGETLYEIARSQAIPYGVLWKWLNVESRMAEYEAALEAKADLEAHRALELADNATPEDVAVARLRVDTRLKLVGKWSKGRYGDGSGVVGSIGGITIVIGDVKPVVERDVVGQPVIEGVVGEVVV